MQFHIVDVFAETKYAGNQLAVVRDAGGLDTEQMQAIAREMNYSETTFITRDEPENGGYNVRIFTPASEVPFAGHPTLGTAYIIQQALIEQAVDEVRLNLQVGQIPVQITYEANQPGDLWMTQPPPDFGSVFEAERLAEVLRLDEADIDSRYPIQDVSTGLPFIVVPLYSRGAVRRCRINLDAHDRLLANTRAKAILVFCPEPYHSDNDLHARMFAPAFGVPEDPATGSANGCLAGYLVWHRYFGTDDIDLRVEQGYEIGRPSLLLLRAAMTAEDTIKIEVGGRVIRVAEGRLV